MEGAAALRQGGRGPRHLAHMRAMRSFSPHILLPSLPGSVTSLPSPSTLNQGKSRAPLAHALDALRARPALQSGYQPRHRRSSRCSHDSQRSAAPASAACRAAAAPPAARAPHRAGNLVPLIILTAGFCHPPICHFTDRKHPTMSSGGQMSQGVMAADEKTTLVGKGSSLHLRRATTRASCCPSLPPCLPHLSSPHAAKEKGAGECGAQGACMVGARFESQRPASFHPPSAPSLPQNELKPLAPCPFSQPAGIMADPSGYGQQVRVDQGRLVVWGCASSPVSGTGASHPHHQEAD